MAIPDLNKLLRKNIIDLVPYSSARDEYSGNDAILMDANENPYNNPYNRYPDPLQRKLKNTIGMLFSISPDKIFLGNGSDEAIDLLFRAFCNPGKDNVVIMDPSYGMYEVCARINDVEIRKVLLTPDFELDPKSILKAVDENSKLIFLCSPNNPTSNLLSSENIITIVKGFNGLLVLDEAYIDFSGTQGLLQLIEEYPNLVILRTFSKAWGLAGIRLGMAIAVPAIIQILNKIKYPYNVNVLSQEKALEFLQDNKVRDEWIQNIITSRKKTEQQLKSLPCVIKVYPSDANFLLVKVTEPQKLYNFLKEHKLIIRDRSRVSLCMGCLRITIGSEAENSRLIELMKLF
jgi:histidinol-phosphate aminotransferase